MAKKISKIIGFVLAVFLVVAFFATAKAVDSDEIATAYPVATVVLFGLRGGDAEGWTLCTVDFVDKDDDVILHIPVQDAPPIGRVNLMLRQGVAAGKAMVVSMAKAEDCIPPADAI